MPDRMIRERICWSRSLSRVSAEAERLFVRNLTHCDGHGRFEADLTVVHTKCFPRMMAEVSEKDVARWLDELQRVETIDIYEVDEELYGFHRSWQKHNTLRAGPRFPAPPPRLERIWMLDVHREREEARNAAAQLIQLDGAIDRRHA